MGVKFFDFNQDGLMDLFVTDMHSDMTRPQTEKALNFTLDIEKSNSFDLVYVPSVSRPTARDLADPQLGTGRANNLLRHVVDLPTKDLGATPPALPRSRPIELLRARIEPARTVVLTCGNPDAMADIAWIAGQTGMRFEKEDW